MPRFAFAVSANLSNDPFWTASLEKIAAKSSHWSGNSARDTYRTRATDALSVGRGRMRPSAIGVAQLKMMWRMPDGYSMSSRRQNGMNHRLRMCRLVVGALVPVMRAACGGLLMVTMVSASKP